jgi:hypothetical protein
MSSQVLHVRLNVASAQAVTTLAETYTMSISQVLRLAVRDFLAHEEHVHTLLATGNPSALVDVRSVAQQHAWLRDEAALTRVDFAPLPDNDRT